MKLIVPCCGRSSRFPNLPPKWMLPSFDGRPMICSAVERLQYDPADLVVTILREHDERFDAAAGLNAAFGRRVETCVLERPTLSQADTVAQTLRKLKLDEPFLVKDSDGAFTLAELPQPHDYVCVESLQQANLEQPQSKSYVRTDAAGRIVEIREKQVISDTFNVGGYYFTSPEKFLTYFDHLTTSAAAVGEIYISHIIGAMLADGGEFCARRVAEYRDWGTLRDWQAAMSARRGYFVSLDGYVFERGNEFFQPRFAAAAAHPAAVAALQSLAAAGHQVTYLSIRPEKFAELTRSQLAAAGAPPGEIVFHCPIAAWTLVAAADSALPLTAANAVTADPHDAPAGDLAGELPQP